MEVHVPNSGEYPVEDNLQRLLAVVPEKTTKATNQGGKAGEDKGQSLPRSMTAKRRNVSHPVHLVNNILSEDSLPQD
jgi:hypothetical protein